MHRWLVAFAMLGIESSAQAQPAQAIVTVATCGESKIEIVPKTTSPGELHGTVAAGGGRWMFSAPMGVVMVGARTRTINVSDVKTQERLPPRAKDAAPSGLIVDLLFDEKKVLLRHSNEGPPDVDYAVDLDRCTFNRDADAIVAGFAPPAAEPSGCAPAVVKGAYRTQVNQAAQLPDADADREAQALCEDHQKTIEARGKLEQAMWDRIARSRITARSGAALLHTEDVREKLWSKIDGCLGADPSSAKGVAALHDGEAKQRTCYSQVKP